MNAQSKKTYETPITETIWGVAKPILSETTVTYDGGTSTAHIETVDDDDDFPFSLEDLYGSGNTSGGSGKVTDNSSSKWGRLGW